MKTTANKIARISVMAVLAVVAITLSSNTVSAAGHGHGHRGIYRYNGPRTGSEAEGHMINALRAMRHASHASHHQSHRLIDWAMRETSYARNEVSRNRSVAILREAKRHMRHYQSNDDVEELEESAMLIKRAIRIEAQTRCRDNWNGRCNTPYPVYYRNNNRKIYVNKSGLALSGKHGKIKIKF